MRFVCVKSGCQNTSTRSGISHTALTKSAVVNILHLIECLKNTAKYGIRIIILNIKVLILPGI